MSRTDDWGDGWNEGREQAIRDCIAAIAPIPLDVYGEIMAVLRALLESANADNTPNDSERRQEKP